MKQKISEILDSAKNGIESLVSMRADEAQKQLSELKIKFLGKKSELTQLVKSIGHLPAEERPGAGALINSAKVKIEEFFDNAREKLVEKKSSEDSSAEGIDVTLPGRRPIFGSIHPLQRVRDEIIEIFGSIGFEVADGPEIENDFHNFEALNFPADHPARDSQDTLYINTDVLLRSHTSTVQVRYMMKNKPPVRVVCPGRVYRNDYDHTHSPMFQQVEGLVVDKGITFGDLKGTLTFFLRKMFGADYGVRFRSSFFPFTEPSAEVDIQCVFCKGSGCNICKRTGWIEIMGCGMVNPAVFKAVGYDTEQYTGFAFGMGIERITMLKYNVNDLRIFFDNDVRFLGQFR